MRIGILSLTFFGALITALLLVACEEKADVAGAAEWPQWRGPNGAGVSTEQNLPVEWTADSPNIRWKAEIPGKGLSQPIVSKGRVFLTTSYGLPLDRRRAVLAIDLASGETLWNTIVFSAQSATKHTINTHATPTAVTDGSHVFAYFGSFLASLNFDGRIVWNERIDPDFIRHSHYGAGSSPVLTDDFVVVFRDTERGRKGRPSWIAAFDKQTGQRIWRSEWDNTCCSYSTPLVVNRSSGIQLLVSTTPEMLAFDARSGEILWTHSYPANQAVPSPVLAGDLLVLPGSIHKRKIVVVRLTGEAGAETVWESTQGVPETSSPVIYKSKLFVVTKGGKMTCYDVRTGGILWRNRLATGIYRSSLVAGDDKIYATSGTGVTSVVAGASKFKLLAENSLDEGSDASVAIADGCLLIRTKRHLYCIEKESSST